MSDRNAGFAVTVIQRDKVCQDCGTTRRLQAHHVTSISEGGADSPDNGIALCPNCHAARHPGVPKGLFLSRVTGKRTEADWNATTLAAELDCSTRTVVRMAVAFGMKRRGSSWAFSDEDKASIERHMGQLNVRVNEITRSQIKELCKRQRMTAGEAITMAIDRFYKEEGKMHIKVEYSEASLFGNVDPEEEGIDAPASVKQFGESLVDHLYDIYPNAEIEVTDSIHDRVFVDGREDHDEVPRINQIIEKVFNGDSWSVVAAD